MKSHVRRRESFVSFDIGSQFCSFFFTRFSRTFGHLDLRPIPLEFITPARLQRLHHRAFFFCLAARSKNARPFTFVHVRVMRSRFRAPRNFVFLERAARFRGSRSSGEKRRIYCGVRETTAGDATAGEPTSGYPFVINETL